MKQVIWWISFVDPDRPKGQRFLGCIVTRGGEEMGEVLQQLHDNGINPGGEALGHVFDKDTPVPDSYMDRLLSRPECETLDALIQRKN
ncbi:hypothetical protein EVC24_139 [Rhizobium phage RHph_I4]|nr:hypothetical protein EVC24_139 [Rhizobium phage RHph_I4]